MGYGMGLKTIVIKYVAQCAGGKVCALKSMAQTPHSQQLYISLHHGFSFIGGWKVNTSKNKVQIQVYIVLWIVTYISYTV